MGFLSEVGDFLFGESPSTEFSQFPRISEEQQAILTDIVGPFFGEINLGGVVGSPLVDLSGTGSLSSLEVKSLAQLEKIAGRPLPFVTPTTTLAKKSVADTLRGESPDAAAEAAAAFETLAPATLEFIQQSPNFELLSAGPTEFEEFYNTNIQQPAVEEFTDVVLPTIDRRYAPSGIHSSGAREQEIEARDTLQEELVSSRADLAFQTEEAAKDRAVQTAAIYGDLAGKTLATSGALAQTDIERELQAAGLAPTLDLTPINALSQTLTAGAVPRQAAQGGAQLALQDAQLQILREANLLDALLGFYSTPTIENVGVTNPGQAGFINTIAGGVGQGVGIGVGGKIASKIPLPF